MRGGRGQEGQEAAGQDGSVKRHDTPAGIPVGAEPASTQSAARRLRRLKMRSARRGMREMDLILGPFAAQALGSMSPDELDAYEALLAESDHDLYMWISGRARPPAERAGLVRRIAAFAARGGVSGI